MGGSSEIAILQALRVLTPETLEQHHDRIRLRPERQTNRHGNSQLDFYLGAPAHAPPACRYERGLHQPVIIELTDLYSPFGMRDSMSGGTSNGRLSFPLYRNGTQLEHVAKTLDQALDRELRLVWTDAFRTPAPPAVLQCSVCRSPADRAAAEAWGPSLHVILGQDGATNCYVKGTTRASVRAVPLASLADRAGYFTIRARLSCVFLGMVTAGVPQRLTCMIHALNVLYSPSLDCDSCGEPARCVFAGSTFGAQSAARTTPLHVPEAWCAPCALVVYEHLVDRARLPGCVAHVVVRYV